MNDDRTHDRLDEMLARWAAGTADERAVITVEIREAFEEELAILVLDMSGFSTTVVRHGITAFLAKIREMRSVAEPAIERHGGLTVKYIADDVLAVFDDVESALAAARDIILETEYDEMRRAPDMQFRVSIGIGFGPTLHIPGADLWGDEANRAFKLGEDTAAPDEILLTERAFTALTERRDECEPVTVKISGVELSAHSHRPLIREAE